MGKIKRLLRTAWVDERSLFLVVMGQSLFDALIPMADIVGIGIVIDALLTGQDRKRVTAVILYYVLVHTGISLVRELLAWLRNIEARKSTNAVQSRYARQSLEVDFPYIQTGRFLSLKRRSMNIMPSFYISTLGNLASCLVKFIGVFSVFTAVNPLLILCILFLSIPVARMSFRQKKAERQYRQDVAREEQKSDYLYKAMTECSYAKDIRIYDGARLLSRKYADNAGSQIGKLGRMGMDRARTQSVSYFFYALQLLCMLAVFSHMVYGKEISIAEYTVLLSSTMLFSSIIAGFLDNVAYLRETCSCMDIMEEYDNFIRENSRVYRSADTGGSCGPGPVAIDFEHVTFRYPGREEAALEDVSFHIAAGEKVSFVGTNGAGKTTIVKLLLRMYEPDSGVIRVDGRDIRELSSKEYYRRIGIVLQDFFLYAYSVRENLCFDRGTDEAELERAIEKSGILERVQKLPKGLDTCLYRNLDPGGVELSGGEGQKLAMARALCGDTGLLIFDEPTSALDPLAEYELFSRMRRISENNTTITVSHRLSSTKYSDRILVFQGGKLIQSGSHRELLAMAGAYRDMYETQAKYYTGEGRLYETQAKHVTGEGGLYETLAQNYTGEDGLYEG